MRIGMILNSEFPPDFRVEKEIQTLLSSHEIFLLCTNRGAEPAKASFNGAQITRVFGGMQRRRATWQMMRTCYSREWRNEIELFIRENHLDALHVHDLPVAGTALEAARSNRIPVVLDLHEDYPAMLDGIKRMPFSRVPSVGVLGLKLAPSINRWREYERDAVGKADAVIAVIDEAAERIRGLGVPASKIHLVPNYGPVPERSDGQPAPATGVVSAIYLGRFDQARELRTVLEAADMLAHRDCLDLRIVLVGGSPREIALLRKYASGRTLNIGAVVFHEWIEREEAEGMVAASQIGLIPHVKSAHTDSTIPNKLFQYMARGVPVVASNCIPMQRIVENSGCGVIYESGDASSLAERIEDLYRNPGKRLQMGNAGLSAAQTTYNWSVAANNLLTTYRKLGKPSA